MFTEKIYEEIRHFLDVAQLLPTCTPNYATPVQSLAQYLITNEESLTSYPLTRAHRMAAPEGAPVEEC
jgi:hypothetical protein